MKKKLLIYAHYYIPDVASTGQILKELAEGLLDKFNVTVICVVPSYSGIIEDKYKKYRYYKEIINNVKILRIRVPEFYKGDKISRIKNILAYFLGAIFATFKVGKQDYILSISQPPIIGGILGVYGKWINQAKYIYNIQDFNPEQIIAINYFKNKFILNIMMWLDKFSCKHSNLIITVGHDLVKTLKKRFKGKVVPKYTLINNWVDENNIYPLSTNDEHVIAFKKQYGLDDKFVIMYSGNIGFYYDLENLIKIIKKFKPGTRTGKHGQMTTKNNSINREVVFAFVGNGSILDKLMRYKVKHNLDNVVFIPYQNKSNLIYSLNAGDVHWCVNAKGIKGVSCPSKYYGLAACAKPILGVLETGSEIQCLIEKTRGGLCCEPGDYYSIEKNLRWFINNADSSEVTDMGIRGYNYLMKYLTKEKSIKRYKEEILNC